MFITLQLAMWDGPQFITFDGTPKECQEQVNAFLGWNETLSEGKGIMINRIILMGEK